MKLDLSNLPKCEKCGSTTNVQRHHKGCQKMFTRHFIRRAGTKTYDEFVKRYWEFRETDIVRLCGPCHLKIHKIYFRIIGRWATKYGRISHWHWKTAHELMHALNNRCDLWLKPRSSLSHQVKHRPK